MYRHIFAVCSLLMALFASPLAAESSGLPPLSAEDAAQFPAVGRIGQVGFPDQGCSGTLIAPDLVVTAAHCIPETGTEGGIFAAHWADGTYSVAGTILRQTRHPEYALNGSHNPQNDVGLVVLDGPVIGVQPIALGLRESGALDGMEVAVVGFHTSSPDQLSGKLDCPAINLSVGQVYLGCQVIQGNSGSPVLVQDEGGNWQVEAIISSRIGPGAIAIYLPDWLRQEVAAHLQP